MAESGTRAKRRMRRKRRIRKKLFGTAERPRMTVFKSHKHIYVQVVDDAASQTLCEASSRNKTLREAISYGGNKAAAVEIGKVIAERTKEKGISRVLFDRNGYRYHGRIKAVADAAREGGLTL